MNETDRLLKEATSFHKTTCLLASKYTGIKDFNPDSHLPFPMMYKDANGHLHRATLPNSDGDDKWRDDADTYFTALIVNGAFSLELHLKHLYLLIEKKKPRGHDLHKLFLELCADTRNTLEFLFQEISNSQPKLKQMFDALNSQLNNKRAWTIESVLQETSKAFEVWRYCYEDKGKTSSFVGYGEAVHAMRTISTQYKKTN
jgi:hypothetical protein